MKTETRAFEIRIESDPNRQGPGILKGILMPYGEVASDRPERFDAGSLHWPESGIVLREMHNRQAPIVRFTPEATESELRVSIPMPDSQRGRDAVLGIRNGLYNGMSVEFHSERERMDGSMRVIERAALVGAGLVDDPSYKGATVEARGKTERRRLWL